MRLMRLKKMGRISNESKRCRFISPHKEATDSHETTWRASYSEAHERYAEAYEERRNIYSSTQSINEGSGEIMPFSKYSPKQKKLARTAPPRDKITAADFKKLKKKKKK